MDSSNPRDVKLTIAPYNAAADDLKAWLQGQIASATDDQTAQGVMADETRNFDFFGAYPQTREFIEDDNETIHGKSVVIYNAKHDMSGLLGLNTMQGGGLVVKGDMDELTPFAVFLK